MGPAVSEDPASRVAHLPAVDVALSGRNVPVARRGISMAFGLARVQVRLRWFGPHCKSGGPRGACPKKEVRDGGSPWELAGFRSLRDWNIHRILQRQRTVPVSKQAWDSSLGPIPKEKERDPEYWRLLSRLGQMRKDGRQAHQMLQQGYLQADLVAVGYDPKDFEPERIEAVVKTESLFV